NALVPNLFVWENLGKSPKDDKECKCDFKGMQAYWEGLTRFRLSERGKIFRFGGKVPPSNYYQFIKPENPYLLGYIVQGSVLVLVNTAEVANRFQVEALPIGNWRLIADGQQVDFVNGLKGTNATLKGVQGTQTVTVPATTAMIWVKD
ncbi:MAG TPA: pullulanase, partial [Bacteroidetes bacterium]|nr:pullulanase [Bacteroidota bacterium]